MESGSMKIRAYGLGPTVEMESVTGRRPLALGSTQNRAYDETRERTFDIMFTRVFSPSLLGGIKIPVKCKRILMIHTGDRTRGGTLSVEVQQKVDALLDEFVAQVDEISDKRQLQKGIARASLPCSLVIVVDKVNLTVLAQLRKTNLSTLYLHYPKDELKEDKALSLAGWQFAFEDPFVIQFPLEMLDQPKEVRADTLRKMAESHVDSEFLRFVGLLNIHKTRPVFGPPPFVTDPQLSLVLSPKDGERRFAACKEVLENNRLIVRKLMNVWSSRSALRETWVSLGQARLVVADLTGYDPEVMYALGLAHALGKDCIIIHNQSLVPLQIPGTSYVALETDGETGTVSLSKTFADRVKEVLEPLD